MAHGNLTTAAKTGRGSAFAAYLKRHEYLYFSLKNRKVVIGVTVFLIFLLAALAAPLLTPYGHEEIAGPLAQGPSLEHPMGTTMFGRDVFTQTLFGLRATFIVGFLGGLTATFIGIAVGFLAGYNGGTNLDEVLMMLANILLVIPIIAVLIIIASYLEVRGVVMEALIVGLFNWPWAARAVRSQALSLRNNEFVDLSRISCLPSRRIIWEDIAMNMFSYVFMVFILQFTGCVLAAVTLDFLGLGPTRGISLGVVMQNAVNWGAINLGMWWWSILPGLILTLLILSFYLINTGLDEIFNPRLRET